MTAAVAPVPARARVGHVLRAAALARPPMLAPTDLAIGAGELVALVGPNGAGKTTLLRALAGLTRAQGEVTLDDAPVGPRALAWLPAAREAPFPIAASDVVALGLARPDPAAVERALTRCDVTHLGNRPLTRLSTGERARVLLARALVGSPAVLLLDEPTANLDPAHALLVARLLQDEAARGAVVLFATHDLTLARGTADRVLVMECGRVVADGPPADAVNAATLAAVFGVTDVAPGFTLTERAGIPGSCSERAG